MILHDPPNYKKNPELWAVMSVNEDGTEGLVAIGSLPLICCDKKNLPKVIELAKGIKNLTKKKFFLFRYEKVEQLEEL